MSIYSSLPAATNIVVDAGDDVATSLFDSFVAAGLITLNKVLVGIDTKIEIGTSASVGDVLGPGSSTDNALARFDLATGKIIQNSVGILDDSGNLSGITNIVLTGTDGIDYSPGSDIDVDLITVGVTDNPKMFWDESRGAFTIVTDTLSVLALDTTAVTDTYLGFFRQTAQKARIQWDDSLTTLTFIVGATGIGDAVMGLRADGEIKIYAQGETDPTVLADTFSIWAANHAGAGTSTFHTKNEEDDIIKLFKSAAYTPTNVTPTRTFDANNLTLHELADVVGTMIADDQSNGLKG